MPRINLTVSDEMKKYFEEKSKETGVSQSALMVMAISEYLDQKKMLNALEILKNVKIDELEKNKK